MYKSVTIHQIKLLGKSSDILKYFAALETQTYQNLDYRYCRIKQIQVREDLFMKEIYFVTFMHSYLIVKQNFSYWEMSINYDILF